MTSWLLGRVATSIGDTTNYDEKVFPWHLVRDDFLQLAEEIFHLYKHYLHITHIHQRQHIVNCTTINTNCIANLSFIGCTLTGVLGEQGLRSAWCSPSGTAWTCEEDKQQLMKFMPFLSLVVFCRVERVQEAYLAL